MYTPGVAPGVYTYNLNTRCVVGPSVSLSVDSPFLAAGICTALDRAYHAGQKNRRARKPIDRLGDRVRVTRAREARHAALVERRALGVLRALATVWHLSVHQIQRVVGGKHALLCEVCATLETGGAIEKRSRGTRRAGWMITQRGRELLAEHDAESSRTGAA